MNIYELICETNKKIIQGESFTDEQKQKITDELLSNISNEDTVKRFHKGVNAPEYLRSLGKSTDMRRMYPMYYITPYNNDKKLRLLTGELPKTHILAANSYEMEILRILAIFAGDNKTVKSMLDNTAERLDTTCFSNFCSAGECPGAGIASLRFWSAYNIKDISHQKKIIYNISKYRDGKGTYKNGLDLPVYYTWLTFCGCDYETARGELEYSSKLMYDLFLKKLRQDTPENMLYGVLRKHIIKNALSIFPEYNFIKEKEMAEQSDANSQIAMIF